MSLATLGAEHPDTLPSIDNVATLLHDHCKRVEAEPLLLEASGIRRTTFGGEHPATFTYEQIESSKWPVNEAGLTRVPGYAS